MGEDLGSGRARGPAFARWRVLAGAALVTIAAGGVVFAHRAAQQPPDTRYVVVTEAVAAGEPLRAEQLGSVAIDLPTAVEGVSPDEVDRLVGRVAAHELAPSALLSESDLAEEGQWADPDEVTVALSLDPARLRGTSISPGRTVHVLGTTDETTSLLATARVVAVGDSGDSGLGDPAGVLVELALADLETSTAVTHAAVNGTVTLVLPSPDTGGNR